MMIILTLFECCESASLSLASCARLQKIILYYIIYMLTIVSQQRNIQARNTCNT